MADRWQPAPQVRVTPLVVREPGQEPGQQPGARGSGSLWFTSWCGVQNGSRGEKHLKTLVAMDIGRPCLVDGFASFCWVNQGPLTHNRWVSTPGTPLKNIHHVILRYSERVYGGLMETKEALDVHNMVLCREEACMAMPKINLLEHFLDALK